MIDIDFEQQKKFMSDIIKKSNDDIKDCLTKSLGPIEDFNWTFVFSTSPRDVKYKIGENKSVEFEISDNINGIEPYFTGDYMAIGVFSKKIPRVDYRALAQILINKYVLQRFLNKEKGVVENEIK